MDKLRRKASRIVNVAIYKGSLKRASCCSYCDRTRNIYAHHDDYSKPLDIIWLCAGCHNRMHNGSLGKMTRLQAIKEQIPVMARYDSLRKLRRNEQLRRYVAENPELSLQEVAGAFGISRQRVYQLLQLAKPITLLEQV